VDMQAVGLLSSAHTSGWLVDRVSMRPVLGLMAFYKCFYKRVGQDDHEEARYMHVYQNIRVPMPRHMVALSLNGPWDVMRINSP